jgi:DNA-binding NtrC family response regulator
VCQWASCGAEALRRVMMQSPEMVVLNPNMDGCEGLRTLEAIKEFNREMYVILYSDESLFGESFDYFLADDVISRQPDHGQLLKLVREKQARDFCNSESFHEAFF